jgi:predicted transcriptional regulator
LNSNLNAEMARCGVKKTDIANLLGLRYATVIDKMSGKSRFYYDECMKIKKKFFPNHSLEYLFSSDNQNTA